MFCDNEGLVKNATLVESSLNKKHSAIAYHFVRWNVAAGAIIADAFTKVLPETKRDDLFGDWTY